MSFESFVGVGQVAGALRDNGVVCHNFFTLFIDRIITHADTNHKKLKTIDHGLHVRRTEHATN